MVLKMVPQPNSSQSRAAGSASEQNRCSCSQPVRPAVSPHPSGEITPRNGVLTEINHSQRWHKHFSYAKMFSAHKCCGTRLQKITLHFSWPAFISHSKSPRQTRAAARSPFHSTAPVLPSWQSVIYRHCLGSVSHTWFFCSHPAVPGTAAGPLPSRGALPRLCARCDLCQGCCAPQCCRCWRRGQGTVHPLHLGGLLPSLPSAGNSQRRFVWFGLQRARGARPCLITAPLAMSGKGIPGSTHMAVTFGCTG